MFETSKDILNISIAVAVVAVAIFICWTMYYLVSNLRRINRISQKVEKGVMKVDGLIDLIKSKVKQSSSYFFLFSKLAERAMDYFSSRRRPSRDEEEDDGEKNGKNKKGKK